MSVCVCVCYGLCGGGQLIVYRPKCLPESVCLCQCVFAIMSVMDS